MTIKHDTFLSQLNFILFDGKQLMELCQDFQMQLATAKTLKAVLDLEPLTLKMEFIRFGATLAGLEMLLRKEEMQSQKRKKQREYNANWKRKREEGG